MAGEIYKWFPCGIVYPPGKSGPGSEGNQAMAMVCPQCHASFDQQQACPTCGVRLLFQANISNKPEPLAEDFGQWVQSPWGRVLAGLILAQGLAHGLQMLIAGTLAASTDVPVDMFRGTFLGLLLLVTIHATSLLVGGAIAGAGQARGMQYAALVGLLNGVIFLLFEWNNHAALPSMTLYLQPLIHVLFGALGGYLGTHVWKPLPTIQVPELAAPSRQPRTPTRGILDGRIHWVRVAIGTVVVIIGVTSSNGIRDWVVDTSHGELKIRDQMQAQLVSWEIAALAALAGAALAGANTSNGLKQGLCVGAAASILLMGIHLSSPAFVLEKTVFTLASTICLALGGGWFGGQLFPPIRRRQKTLSLY